MKHLFKIVLFNFLLFNSLLYGEVDNHTNYEAFEYGYNLKASKTLSSKDMSDNVKKCNLLNSDSEIFYCIVGVSEKTSKAELLSIDDMQRLNLEAYMQFVNERRTYVFNEDYRIKLQKEIKINREKALLNKQISSSNMFFIGIHTENLSEHGLRFGYASSSKSIRYSAYYTQHTFKNKNQDLGATEIGVDLKIPFFNYKSYDIVPY
ncbi:MAG: hypothetical protein U9N59_10745, partial [Campylobacterota bacterium]|nr:hypothetical protein [Campylobacterota bacterium]